MVRQEHNSLRLIFWHNNRLYSKQLLSSFRVLLVIYLHSYQIFRVICNRFCRQLYKLLRMQFLLILMLKIQLKVLQILQIVPLIHRATQLILRAVLRNLRAMLYYIYVLWIQMIQVAHQEDYKKCKLWKNFRRLNY